MPTYLVREGFTIDVGFLITAEQTRSAADFTNDILHDLPATLYRSIDFKTVSSVVGAVFCDVLAREVGAIVNPIEKGHPDVVPQSAAGASEAQLRNYPHGLEVKSTVGNITQGANLRAGQQRVNAITGITWQAHHQEVGSLMGLVWDFASERDSFLFPAITGIFYSDKLLQQDWGAISGTTGRNTKVCGMRSSAKRKMAAGWVLLHDDARYLEVFRRTLGVNTSL